MRGPQHLPLLMSLFVTLQHLMPQLALTQLAGRIAGVQAEDPGPEWQREDHRGRLLRCGRSRRG